MKTVISLFIVLNLATVLIMNRPVSLAARAGAAINRSVSPAAAWQLSRALWLDEMYAHYLGLDNRWVMFGRQSRFNWWFVIKAVYRDQAIVTLPLPSQSDRTFWQRHFADFKEAKLDLNLYADRNARAAYADYLRRSYPEHDGAGMASIVWEIHWQNLRSPEEARSKGSHLEAEVHHRLFDTFEMR